MSDVAYPFTVAVAGAADVIATPALARLVELLVNRHRGNRRIILYGIPGGPVLLPWAHERGWSVYLGSGGRNVVRRDCELIAWADALLVIGSPEPWARLLALAREGRIPTRVFETCPRLPPKVDLLEYPAEG